MSPQSHPTNQILETSISITNISTASAIAQRILDLGPAAANITKLHISTDFSSSDDKAKFIEDDITSLVRPITSILTHISSLGSSLIHFTWLAPSSTSSPFTRPSSFWAALYLHAPTLTSLTLEFFEHEVQHFPPPPPFPNLKTLELDTSSAHGDSGASIHALLRSCKSLTTLKFEWPGCDLETCQIQNIEWDTYTFPALTYLEVHGWDFAPLPLARFLARHQDVQRLLDGVEGPYIEENEGHIDLDVTAFPNLRDLWKRRVDARPLAQYFSARANRPIKRLVLDLTGFHGAEKLAELSNNSHACAVLEKLEIRGPSRAWRNEEWESDSSEDET
jgi:hypothetical protein